LKSAKDGKLAIMKNKISKRELKQIFGRKPLIDATEDDLGISDSESKDD
jgi:hypothetical protein